MIGELLLNNGVRLPQVGLGTWPLTDESVVPAIVSAIEAGYRHVDTAYKYGNERGVGEGIRRSGLPREALFVTTKLDGTYQGDDRAIAGLADSLERLGLDYVDLLLIHWPLPGRDEYVSTWRTFEHLVAEGRTRAIGVSNFKPEHLARLIAETDIVPAVNQVQLTPYVPRHAERDAGVAYGIITESWSPLGRGSADLLGAEPITAIARRINRTPAQVVLRWHVQSGLAVIPKSANAERIRENIEIYDFALTDDDLASIATLNRGPGSGVDSDRTGH